MQPVRVGKSQAAAMYRSMRLIRRFEEKVVELVNANEIAGVTHEYAGEEAVAVGVCSALRPDDIITSTHRGHGHVIAKGAEVRRMVAELLGREDGFNRGRGGSMHIADFQRGVMGANGIVGASQPMACGAAYAFRRRGEDRVVASFFGEGGSNQGVLLESLNLAAIWSLPVIFVCENNQYAVSSHISRMSKVAPYQRAAGFGLPGLQVDGMDVQAVYDATAEAVERARAGGGPTLMECETYRFYGHFTAERVMNLNYRSEEEIQAWRQRDPIVTWGARLQEQGLWTAEEQAAMDADVDREMEEAVAFARASAWPSPETALDHLYAGTHPGLPARGL